MPNDAPAMYDSLTKAVVTLLRSAPVKKISFAVFNIKIDGPGFEKVAAQVESGGITVYYDPTFTKARDASSAYYAAKRDTMYLGFKTLGLRDDKAMVVHEAVHALNDVLGATVLPIHDEMAGYIAQAMYYRYAGLGYPKMPDLGPSATVNLIYEAAFAVADTIADGADPKGAQATLADVIKSQEEYKDSASKRVKYGGISTESRWVRYAGK